jgi:menaquinone-dependent protoporphyrinogen IX oxidase
MPKSVLVAYYSNTGRSKAAAEDIAHRLDADLERIEPVGHDPGSFFGYLGAAVASLFGDTWPIKPPTSTAVVYELVVICAPVWAGRLAPPAREWLNVSRARIKDIAACATVGGTKGPRFFADVAKAAAKPIRARAVITEGDWKSGAHNQIIDHFVGGLAQPALAAA